MRPLDYGQLISDIKDALAADARATFAIIGHTPLSYDLLADFGNWQAGHRLLGIYHAGDAGSAAGCSALVKTMPELQVDAPSIAVIASDLNKEKLLVQATPYLTPTTRIVLAG